MQASKHESQARFRIGVFISSTREQRKPFSLTVARVRFRCAVAPILRPVVASAIAYALLAACAASVARADDPHADAAFSLAESKEQTLDLADALHAYERAETLAPLGPHAAAARARAEFLRSHSDGNFVPLAALERVRRDPARATDANELAELGTQSRSFPTGQVRVETWQFLAMAHARRREDAQALVFARLALADPAADPVMRTDAASLVAETCLRRGDTACARDAARAGGVSADVRARIQALVRRRSMALVAGALLATIVLASLVVMRRSRSRLARPTLRTLVLPALAMAVIVTCGVAASSFEGASLLPFVLLGLGVLALSLLGAQVASVVRGAAGLRAASFALAVVAAAFLSLYASGPDYLTDFGL